MAALAPANTGTATASSRGWGLSYQTVSTDYTGATVSNDGWITVTVGETFSTLPPPPPWLAGLTKAKKAHLRRMAFWAFLRCVTPARLEVPLRPTARAVRVKERRWRTRWLGRRAPLRPVFLRGEGRAPIRAARALGAF